MEMRESVLKWFILGFWNIGGLRTGLRSADSSRERLRLMYRAVLGLSHAAAGWVGSH